MDEVGHAVWRDGSGDLCDVFGMVDVSGWHGWGGREVQMGMADVPRYILRESVG